MAAHKHAEMIKAKADNMELVVFVKDDLSGELKWRQMVNSFPISVNHDYFLCLPQHKEACLHWLNGGLIEYNLNLTNRWEGCADYNGCLWELSCGMMREDANYRIKPRKEKLWIAVKTDKHETLGGCRKVRICSHAFVNKHDAEDYLDLRDSQLIEIEVEV